MQNLIDVCFRRAGVLGVLDDYYIGLFSSDFAVFATFWVVFMGFCGLKSSERFTFSFQNLVRFFGFWLFRVAVLRIPSSENIQ